MTEARPDPALVAMRGDSGQLNQGNGQPEPQAASGKRPIRLRGSKSPPGTREAIALLSRERSPHSAAPSASSKERWMRPKSAKQLAGQANRVATMLLNGEVDIEVAKAYATTVRTISTLLGEETARARYVKAEPDLSLEDS